MSKQYKGELGSMPKFGVIPAEIADYRKALDVAKAQRDELLTQLERERFNIGVERISNNRTLDEAIDLIRSYLSMTDRATLNPIARAFLDRIAYNRASFRLEASKGDKL